ncbi:hypothetical protein OG607_41710 [Streptomyces sp. NBC_01537]|uniref:hypothetical protein n=1 Tax=Streptomyces sp. NBC_01537 TaxID=2903896 RepID=UPI003863BE2D
MDPQLALVLSAAAVAAVVIAIAAVAAILISRTALKGTHSHDRAAVLTALAAVIRALRGKR